MLSAANYATYELTDLVHDRFLWGAGIAMAVVLAARRKQTKYPLRLLVRRSNLLLHSYIRCRYDSCASGLYVFMGRLLRTSLPRLVIRFQTTAS